MSKNKDDKPPEPEPTSEETEEEEEEPSYIPDPPDNSHHGFYCTCSQCKS